LFFCPSQEGTLTSRWKIESTPQSRRHIKMPYKVRWPRAKGGPALG
jgi:hypothetical protein